MLSILATTTTILYSQRICNHLQIKYVLFFLKFSLSYLQSNISNGSTHFSMRTPSLFHILSERSFTRNSFKMLADISSCLPKECDIYCRPVHAFWCFSFERFNGILGTMQVNGRSVEIQLMRKLKAGRFVWDVKFPNEFQEHFLPFFARYESHDLFEDLVVENVTKLFNSAYRLNFQTHSSILHWIQMS